MPSDPMVLCGVDMSGLDAKKPANPNTGSPFMATDVPQFYVHDGTTFQPIGCGDPLGLGAKNGAAVSCVERTSGMVHCTDLTLTNLHLPTVDAGTNGAQGSVKLYDFPQGRIEIVGVAVNVAVLVGGYAGIANTSTVLLALGTAAPANTDTALTGTEANILASTAGTLSGGIATFKAGGGAQSPIDGTATAIDLLLNATVDATGSSADSALVASGTVRVLWINHGLAPAITAPTTSTTTTTAAP